MNERMPYYMAYPVPFSYDDERTERRDIEYLRSMYPDIPKRLLPYVEEECDRMEYENSMVYDQYPDKLQLKLMCRRICDNVRKHERIFQDVGEVEETERGDGRRRNQGGVDSGFLRDLGRHERLSFGDIGSGDCACGCSADQNAEGERRQSGNHIEAQSLRDLIEVMLYQEIYRRRCDHRRRCRRFY